jgi:prophage regulatory protein
MQRQTPRQRPHINLPGHERRFSKQFHSTLGIRPRQTARSEEGGTLIPANDEPRLISVKDAAKMTGMSRSMISVLRAEGKFPVAVSLGERKIVFVRAEVESWIDQRIASRGAA